MIKVIGTPGCARCEMVKRILTQRGKEFEYAYYDDLSDNEQACIDQLVEDAGIMSFPIILENFKIVDIKDVI